MIVTSSSDEKLERVKALGASHGINYARTPYWEKAVLDLTGQKGVDHVLEVVGGRNLVQSITAVKAAATSPSLALWTASTSAFHSSPLS